MSRPRLLLAEDHTGVAQSLAFLLADDFEIVGAVGDGRALVEAARQLKPDVIIADIQMPVLGGLEALRQLRNNGSDVPILLLTGHDDARLAGEAMRAGANGFVTKQKAADELHAAIGELLQGRLYVRRVS